LPPQVEKVSAGSNTPQAALTTHGLLIN
jgi:hypothetical protein